MRVLHLFRSPALSDSELSLLLRTLQEQVGPEIEGIETEYCFNVGIARKLRPDEFEVLRWLLAETFEPGRFGTRSFLDGPQGSIVEVGRHEELLKKSGIYKKLFEMQFKSEPEKLSSD